MKKVIVVGAGLGGLSTAGLLANRGFEVTVLERTPIVGGRSHVLAKDGFTLCYGTHAILAPKADPVKSIFKELGIHLNYNKPSISKFKLYSNGQLQPSILGLGAFHSPAINGFFNHLVFFKKFLQMVKAKPIFDKNLTVEGWIRENIKEPSIAKVVRAYAALTVYDAALNHYSMNSLVELANCEYSTIVPLAYAGYDELLEQLRQSVLKNGGAIHLGCEVRGLVIQDGMAAGVVTKDQVYTADTVILNVPPQAISKIVDYEPFNNQMTPFLIQPSQYVYVYDIMLSKRIRKDVTNILDLDEYVYVNDCGLNIPSSAPKEGQLLLCIKLLKQHEQGDDNHAEQSKKSVERILDHVYSAWRNHVVGTRIIKRAMVNGIARHVGKQPLPLKSDCIKSLYFVGDSVAGRGALGLPAYDSALSVANMIERSEKR